MFSPSRFSTAISAAALLALAGCSSHVGKSTPTAMVGARETTRAWISEGSSAHFADTERLSGTKTDSHGDLEGWVDEQLAIRYGSVAPGDEGYDGEAAWTVEFAEPIARLAAAGRLNGSAKVRLRGTVNGRELGAFSHPGRADMAPFGIGNNVLTDAGTPWTTLAALDSTGGRYQLRVHLRSRNGDDFEHSSEWSDVGGAHGQPPSAAVLAAARALASLTAQRHPEWSDLRLLNLGAQGAHSGFAQEHARKKGAFWGTFVHPDEALEGAVRGGLAPAQIRTRLGRQISDNDATVFGRIELKLLAGDSVIGRATLNMVSPYSGH